MRLISMKKLIIIIPAFNEEKGIAHVIDGIPEKVEGIEEINILVIDDGSTDGTKKIVEKKGIEVISHPHNCGLGVAFRRGIDNALKKGADVIVNIDADGQFDPGDIPQLVGPILQGQAEVVTASRFISKDHKPSTPRIRLWGNRLMSFIISRIVGKKYHDVSCGYRAYSREAALKLNLFGKFTYTQETFINLAAKDIPIIEIPVMVRGDREYGESKISSNLFRYGILTLRIIIGAFRDFKPLRLMSYISLLFTVVGTSSGIFFLIHYIRTGAFRPHTWAGFLAFASFVLALFMIVVGVFMEMFSRMRMNQEQLLYHSKKEHYEKLSD
jgi:glycosyltransferase involved in cell wall biosynthesis